MLHI
jgi:hypothetical protein